MTDTRDDNALDEAPNTPGNDSWSEYLERLNEGRRKNRESHDAIQAIIDANRARRS